MTKIEWVKSPDGTQGKTWNVSTGCTPTSTGCSRCYARTMHARLAAMGTAKYQHPFNEVHFHPETLDVPLKRKKPTTWFINSMSDLFHEDVTNQQIAAVFGVMAACPQHTFQVLTKRADRLPKWFAWAAEGGGLSPDEPLKRCRRAAWNVTGDFVAKTTWPLPNVWLGVSIEDEPAAKVRVPLLIDTPAALRFVSCEPLLGEIRQSLVGIDWVIAGCESGPRRRATDAMWFRRVRQAAHSANAAFFLKQMDIGGKLVKMPALDGKVWAEMPPRIGD